MFTNAFGRYVARAPGALPQFRTFSTRLGPTTQLLSSTHSTTAQPTAGHPTGAPHSTGLSSTYRSLHTSLSVWDELTRKIPSSGRKDDAPLYPPSRHLYINRLPRDATEDEIRDFISQVTQMDDFKLRLARREDGTFVGAVYIDFPTTEDAEHAKHALITADHDMGRIWVNFSLGPKRPDIMEKPTSSIFIGVDEVIPREAFEARLASIPGVREIRYGIAQDQSSRVFVDFESVEAATAAQAALIGTPIKAGESHVEIARCNFARPRKDLERRPVAPTSRLYIRDLPSDTVDELQTILQEHEGFDQLFHPEVPAPRWALAYFNSVEYATKAFESLKDLRLSNRPVKIKYGTSQTEPKSQDSVHEFSAVSP